MSNPEDEAMMAIRARVRRSIQSVFAVLATVSLIIATYLHHSPGLAGVSAVEARALADGFLFLGAANAVTMWIWDWLFWHDLNT